MKTAYIVYADFDSGSSECWNMAYTQSFIFKSKQEANNFVKQLKQRYNNHIEFIVDVFSTVIVDDTDNLDKLLSSLDEKSQDFIE